MTLVSTAPGRSIGLAVGIAVLAAAMGLAGMARAEVAAAPPVAGKIDWGIWVDLDGCMHWWADGGGEGYMLDRVDPKTGRAVCLKKNTCLVENTDTLFATDQAALTADGRRRVAAFFQSTGAFGYAIYGHTDARASASYNQGLSERRADAVADVARSVGAMVTRQQGFGESMPVAANDTAENLQKNRRVEIVCYRWSR